MNNSNRIRNFKEAILNFPIKEPFKISATSLSDGRIQVTMYKEKEPVSVLKVICKYVFLTFDQGYTYEKYRRCGYGTWIRALVAWAAKRTGYIEITQRSVNIERLSTAPNKRPPSAFIMNKLGFRPNYRMIPGRAENRSLNLRKNTPQINAIVNKMKRNSSSVQRSRM